MTYRIEQVAAGNNWQVKGPGMRSSDPCYSREDAERIRDMAFRAFKAGLATGGFGKVRKEPDDLA